MRFVLLVLLVCACIIATVQNRRQSAPNWHPLICADGKLASLTPEEIASGVLPCGR